MKHRNAAAGLLILYSAMVCLTFCSKVVCAQNQELTYINTDMSLLKRWDNKEIKPLSKTELRSGFEKKLDIRTKYKPYGYEDDEWKAYGIALWEKYLPEEVKPEIPFSDRSRWILIGLFMENLPKYMKFVSYQAIETDLLVSLFCLVGIAQPEALKANQNSITLPYLIRALDVWKCSQIWPKCKAEKHDKKK